jgi:hypothetical protein
MVLSTKMAVVWVLIAVMMEAVRTSEMLVHFYQTTQRYNPEDSHLHRLDCWSVIPSRSVANIFLQHQVPSDWSPVTSVFSGCWWFFLGVMAVGVGSSPFTSVYYLHEECVELYITTPFTLDLSEHAAFMWPPRYLKNHFVQPSHEKLKYLWELQKDIGFFHNIRI